MSRPAVFLDRDGTLIEDREYLSQPEGVRLLPGVASSLQRLEAAGFACVVITNQSGIGRGMFTEADYHRVNDEMTRQLAAQGARLETVYFCPAAPAPSGFDADEHPERKPAPGLFLRAAREGNLDLARSWSVGDSLRDLIAGRRAGCFAGILVRTGKALPDRLEVLRKDWFVVDSLPDAVDTILGNLAK